MQLLNNLTGGIQYLLYAINVFSKYAWVDPMKDKKYITITKSFQKHLDESEGNKAGKTWEDKDSELYNRSM